MYKRNSLEVQEAISFFRFFSVHSPNHWVHRISDSQFFSTLDFHHLTDPWALSLTSILSVLTWFTTQQQQHNDKEEEEERIGLKKKQRSNSKSVKRILPVCNQSSNPVHFLVSSLDLFFHLRARISNLNGVGWWHYTLHFVSPRTCSGCDLDEVATRISNLNGVGLVMFN